MSANSPVGIKDQKERPNFLVEVSNAEKQLWTLIQTKGLLQSDVQESYRKICSSYEKILLNVQERELQDVEYSLWKLHYKHIDEFRKIIKRSSIDSEKINSLAPQNVAAAKRSTDSHVNRFNSFISEASEFYSSLIVKLRTCYGLPEELSISEGGCMFTSLEQKKVQISQFLCHRFLVCLGDLARYREQYGKPGVEKHNWSTAASHYLEATMIWPDSGNPQNQLAVLATYVGDEFLALYHCIRSLAVKEPFPDAWNNLILLFERNRTSHLISLDSDSRFDFLKPYERAIAQAKSHSCDDNSNNNVVKAVGNGLKETNLWPLIIVSTSFFFVESRLEDFPKAFASTVEMLDALMVLDDTKLKAALESYQCMGSARAGPFRSLQVVSIFIFVIDNLFKNTKVNSSKDRDDMQQLELVQLAMAATFVFMGRFVDRCSKANKLISFPLLPAVLVFVEWLVNVLHQAERYGTDDKSLRAMSYFFGAFIQLLKNLGGKTSEVNSSNSTALWEDYELRGFAPISCAHASLEFSTQWGLTESFESRAECRAHRIISAATKIAARSSNTRKWILYDEVGNNFCGADFLLRTESVEPSGNDLEVNEPHQHDYRVTEGFDREIVEEESSSKCSENGKSVAVEEEEVILLKPLTRYNSAPLYGSYGDDQMLSKNTGDQTVPADECLRRATSLLIAQNPAEGDSFTFHSDLSNFSSNMAVKQTESPIKDTAAHPFSEMAIGAGPPSLSSWVLNRVSLSNDGEKKKNVLNRQGLPPIEESFNDLSVISYDYPSYSAPVPSAPLLPDDAVWFKSLQSSFSDQKSPSNIGKTDTYTDALKDNSFPSWTATNRPVDYGPSVSGFMHGYSPSEGMTSSEWLRKYRESQSLEGVNSHQPVHSYVPRNPENFIVTDASRSGLSDQRRAPLASNPLTFVDRPPPFYPSFALVYGVEEQRGRHFNGSRPSPHGYGRMTDFRDDPQPLLHYLKEREWLLRRDPTIRGPAYMGN